MKILCLLAGTLLVCGPVVAKMPPVDVVTEELQLTTNELLLTRDGTESFIYQFPNPMLRVMKGTTINVFGIKNPGDFTLRLYSVEDNPSPEAFTISKSGKGWKVEYKSASQEYEDVFDMPKDKFVWFIIEKTNEYLALYRIGEAKPILKASNTDLNTKFNFNTLQKFRVSSNEKANWDFLGYKYDKKEALRSVKYPFSDDALQTIKKSYKDVTNHLRRCEYAQANLKSATKENNEQFFFTFFIAKNCRDKGILLQLRDMWVRYRTILLVTGVNPPEPPTDDKCKTFIMDKRSLKL